MLEPARPASCPFAVYPSSTLFSCRPLFYALFACAKPVGRGRPAFFPDLRHSVRLKAKSPARAANPLSLPYSNEWFLSGSPPLFSLSRSPPPKKKPAQARAGPNASHKPEASKRKLQKTAG